MRQHLEASRTPSFGISMETSFRQPDYQSCATDNQSSIQPLCPQQSWKTGLSTPALTFPGIGLPPQVT